MLHTLDGIAKSQDFASIYFTMLYMISDYCQRTTQYFDFSPVICEFQSIKCNVPSFEIHLKSLLNLAQMCTLTLYVTYVLKYCCFCCRCRRRTPPPPLYPLNHLYGNLVCMKF